LARHLLLVPGAPMQQIDDMPHLESMSRNDGNSSPTALAKLDQWMSVVLHALQDIALDERRPRDALRSCLRRNTHERVGIKP